VKDHALASELLAEGVVEGVVRCTYAHFQCQARIDWINPGRTARAAAANTQASTAAIVTSGPSIVDLKTVDELDSFEFALRALGYVHQAAFYRSLVTIAGGKVLPVHVVAVEKREPFRVGIWRITSAVLDLAQEQNEEAMAELRRCRATGNWFTRYEELRVIDRL